MKDKSDHKTLTPTAAEGRVTIKRREVLIGMLATVGALSSVGCAEKLDKMVMSVNKGDITAAADNLLYYTQSEFQLVTVLSDLIIPATDTPGAAAVGVPKLIDALYGSWASADSKLKHRKGLKQVAIALDKSSNGTFLNEIKDKQISGLRDFDAGAYSSDWQRTYAYRDLKQLIARFYYLSEVGATQELRYEPVPGRWEACIPFENVGRTWAT